MEAATKICGSRTAELMNPHSCGTTRKKPLPTHIVDEVADVLGVGRPGPVLGCSQERRRHVITENIWPVIQSSVYLTQIVVLIVRKQGEDKTAQLIATFS